MITKSEVRTVNEKFVFTLDLKVDSFFDEPWSLLGKRITFDVDSSTSMTMFQKCAKTWKWTIPQVPVKAPSTDFAAIHLSKRNSETRKLGNPSPDTMSTISLRKKSNVFKTSEDFIFRY